ncbi:MAG: AgmX/PglI C-terminal domain-containing protein [Deltaproteobacteria bacterium]|nr:AgmX/PglI C-terminal domain-containing protein [Kofleriaceae bacterium]
MRPRARVALVCLVLAACGEKEGGTKGAASTPSAGPSASDEAAADPFKGLAVPEIAAGARAERVPDGPALVVKATSITFEGEAIAEVADGKVHPAELMGGSIDPRIARLEHVAVTRAKMDAERSEKTGEPREQDTVLVAIDPALPSELALQVVRSFRVGEQERFGFLVRTPEGPGAVPVTVPAVAPPVTRPAPGQDPDEVPLGVVVALIPDRVLVVSLSRLEGTLADPRLDLRPASDPTWLTRLRDDLTEIATRRWYGRTRPAHQHTIYVIADGSVASGDLVAAIAAVRHDAKGQPLFPDVHLLTGIELDMDGDAAAAKAPEPPKTDAAAKAAEEARRRAEMMALQEDTERWAALLAGAEDSSDENDLRRRPGADLAAEIEKVREHGSQVAIGGAGGGRVGGPDTGGAAIAGRGDGGDAIKTPSGRISVADKTAFDDTSLTADEVLRKLQSAYMAGVKRCYKNELKKDPELRGAVELRLTVNETGRVVGPRASGFHADLDRCMQAMMASWRFPVPKDVDGEATEASFRIKLVFAPE